jgi:uncharacterized protein (TIGR04255 family)
MRTNGLDWTSMNENKLKSPNYARAPLTEAVIDLRVTEPIGANEQEKVVQRLKKRYPNVSQLQAIHLNVDTTGSRAGIEQHPQGFRLSTDEQSDIVLVQPQGVVVARLAPYGGWERHRAGAEFVWREWRAHTANRPIARIGVRYINRIDIPSPPGTLVDIEDYLQFSPRDPNQ